MEPPLSGDTAPLNLLDLRGSLRILRYRKGLFILLVTLVTLASGILAYVLPNVYRASTIILLDQRPIAEAYVGSVRITPDLEQRLRIFRILVMSESLLKKVITRLNLVPNTYDPVAVQEMITELRERISVRIKGTDSLQLSYEGVDPRQAMQITNELANFFLEDTLRFMEKGMEGTSEFLQQELAQTEQELDSQEQKILAFKGQYRDELPNKIVANQRALDRALGQLEGIERRVHDLKGKKDLAQKELAEYLGSGSSLQAQLEARGDQLKALQARYKTNHPAVMLLVREIQELRSKVEGERRDGSNPPSREVKDTLGQEEIPQHPMARILNRQIQEYELEQGALTREKALLLQKVEQLATRVAQATVREKELIRLTRGYDVLQERFQALMNKNLDAHLSMKLEELQREEKFQVLDPASLPVIPIRPHRWLIVAAGLVMALVVGFGGVFLTEIADQTIRTSDDLTRSVHLPLLASIPRFGSVPPQKPKATNSKNFKGEEGHSPKPNGRPIDPTIVMYGDPSSILAEQYRHLRTSVKLLTRGETGKIFVVTSALPGEGKSVSVANLALTMALEKDQNVLLVDAELRRASIHKLLGLKIRPGLADVLSGACHPDSAFQAGPVDRLTVLTAGDVLTNPADLFTPGALVGFFSKMRGQFTTILLDSPPILPVTDTCLLAPYTDGILLVVRAGVAGRHSFTEIWQRLGNAQVLGIVFNAVEPLLLKHRYDYYSYCNRDGSGAIEA